MRVSAALMTLLAATSAVFARPNRDYSRATRTVRPSDAELSRRMTEVVAARQFHYLQTREPLLDVCANIDTDALLGQSELLGIPLKDILGLKLCLCLSALPLKLGLSAQLDALINDFGAPLINAVVELLINTAPTKKQCTFPEHSIPACSSDPCNFDCKPPFVKVGDKCECEPPYTLCNGQCVKTPTGVCNSAVPQPHARRQTLHADAQSSCRSHEEVCGVYGSTKYAYECINTQKNLESCGGCVIPNPFLLPTILPTAATGVDCTAIDHAGDVSCVSGRCIVQTCEDGWEVDAARATCVPKSSTGAVLEVLADFWTV
ncbi:hypothetical protein BDW22DRAFT_1210260 [Trametopsis cervina]|nr:hypothetical protein BDW22DRAFT_1210260 [Trametopsis cervina]